MLIGLFPCIFCNVSSSLFAPRNYPLVFLLGHLFLFPFYFILHESIVSRGVANLSGSPFLMAFHKVRSSSVLLSTSSFLI
jgi:hypothetical protein